VDELTLLDWKRRIFALYAEVRAADDPESAWQRWREPAYFPYDAPFRPRLQLRVQPVVRWDDRLACPLTRPANRLNMSIAGGELVPS